MNRCGIGSFKPAISDLERVLLKWKIAVQGKQTKLLTISPSQGI
jgi:hypothetical protein